MVPRRASGRKRGATSRGDDRAPTILRAARSCELPMAQTAPTDALACPDCNVDQAPSGTFGRYRVCEACGHHAPLGARERLALLVDADSFTELDERLVSVDPLDFQDRVTYRERLAQAKQR